MVVGGLDKCAGRVGLFQEGVVGLGAVGGAGFVDLGVEGCDLVNGGGEGVDFGVGF